MFLQLISEEYSIKDLQLEKVFRFKNKTKHIRDASTILPEHIQGTERRHNSQRARSGMNTLQPRDFCLEGLISVFSVAETAQSSSFVCHPVMKEGSVTDTDNNRSEPRKNTTPRRLNRG